MKRVSIVLVLLTTVLIPTSRAWGGKHIRPRGYRWPAMGIRTFGAPLTYSPEMSAVFGARAGGGPSVGHGGSAYGGIGQGYQPSGPINPGNSLPAPMK